MPGLTKPGATASTRIPSPATSLATPTVQPSHAPFPTPHHTDLPGPPIADAPLRVVSIAPARLPPLH